MDDAEVRDRVARVEQLLDGLDERGIEAVGAVVELYGEALRRIVGGASLTKDELVELSDTVARIRLASGCRRGAVEEAVLRVAPELDRIEIVSEPKLLQIGSFR